MNHRIAILHDPCYLEFPVNVEKTRVSGRFHKKPTRKLSVGNREKKVRILSLRGHLEFLKKQKQEQLLGIISTQN